MTNITRIVLGEKVLAELLANKTVVILGKDRKFDGNVVITFGTPGSIEYNNIITAIQQGQIATLECEGLIFRDDVIVKTFGENDPALETLGTPVIVLVDEGETPLVLNTPTIYLSESQGLSAILGEGILGLMVLGKDSE